MTRRKTRATPAGVARSRARLTRRERRFGRYMASVGLEGLWHAGDPIPTRNENIRFWRRLAKNARRARVALRGVFDDIDEPKEQR
jgi:hypothetical protein